MFSFIGKEHQGRTLQENKDEVVHNSIVALRWLDLFALDDTIQDEGNEFSLFDELLEMPVQSKRYGWSHDAGANDYCMGFHRKLMGHDSWVNGLASLTTCKSLLWWYKQLRCKNYQ